MTTLCIRTSLLALSFAAMAACDAPAPDFGTGAVDDRCGYCGGGIKLNTNKIGAHVFSEIDTLGDKHDGVILVSVDLERFGTADNVWAEAGELVGLVNNHEYRGFDFLQSVWHLQVELSPDNWTDATMVITDVTQDPLYGWKYTFVHEYLGGPKELYPNCDKDDNAANGEEFDAIVTENVTVDTDTAVISERPNTLFIGCLSGGVGKAGFWGYPRHKVGGNTNFTAAVRMVRADYCGTGHSFTVPGQKLSTTDVYGYNSLVNLYDLESVWDVEGAACVYRPRLASDYPDAVTVQKICDELGGRIPAECDANDDLATVADSLFMSVNPL